MAAPKLLLLDEPSLGLAPLLVREIFEIIRAIPARGTTVLLVEQNAHMALEAADRAYVLETGSVALAGRGEGNRGGRAGTTRLPGRRRLNRTSPTAVKRTEG